LSASFNNLVTCAAGLVELEQDDRKGTTGTSTASLLNLKHLPGVSHVHIPMILVTQILKPITIHNSLLLHSYVQCAISP